MAVNEKTNENMTQAMGKRRIPVWVKQAVGLSTLLVVGGTGAIVAVYAYNNRTPHIAIPMPVVPADNGYDDFIRAGKMAQTAKHKSPLDMAEPAEKTETYANYKACVPEAALVEAIVRQGLRKPYMLPPVRSYTNPQFPSFALLREIARTLAGKARYEAISGHPEQAIDTLLDSMEMGVTMPRGGNFISGLVGVAVEAISIRPMEDLLLQLNPEQLAHVAARLDVIVAKRVPFADIMQEEGNFSVGATQNLLSGPDSRGLKGISTIGNALVADSSDDSDGKPTWRERLQAVNYMFANKQALLTRHQTYFNALVTDARQPYHGASTVSTSNDPLLKMLADVFVHARDKFAGMEAAMNLLQTEVALERYRLANGQYPTALAALISPYAPAYLKTIPRDVCTGRANQPLRYTLKSGGSAYLLYSVGTDMRDDGGKPSKTIGTGEGDIVAQHLWPTKMRPIAVPDK